MAVITSKDGSSITVEQSGTGPAVILIGGPLTDQSNAQPLASLLATQFTVFTYDRRGRGDSDNPAPCTPECEIDDLEALLRQMGGSAFVYGHSSGGLLALAAAAQGLTIPKLALYEPPVVVNDNDRQATAGLVSKLTEMLSAGQRDEMVDFWLTINGMPAERIGELRREPGWSTFRTLAHTLVYDCTLVRDTWAAHSLTDSHRAAFSWTALSQLTLVIDGGDSPWWVGNHAVQSLVNALPNARRQTVAGQKNEPDPAVLAPLLTAFFNP